MSISIFYSNPSELIGHVSRRYVPFESISCKTVEANTSSVSRRFVCIVRRYLVTIENLYYVIRCSHVHSEELDFLLF